MRGWLLNKSLKSSSIYGLTICFNPKFTDLSPRSILPPTKSFALYKLYLPLYYKRSDICDCPAWWIPNLTLSKFISLFKTKEWVIGIIDSILISTVNSWLFFKNPSQLLLTSGKTSSLISWAGVCGCKGIKSRCTFYNKSFAGYHRIYSIACLVSIRLLILFLIAMFGYQPQFVQLSCVVIDSSASFIIFPAAHWQNFGNHRSTSGSSIDYIQIQSIYHIF